MAASLLIVIPFFGTYDIQAFLTRAKSNYDIQVFLTGVEPSENFQIANLEFALVVAIVWGINFLYGLVFRHLAKYVNRKLKKDVEWERNSMG